MADVNARATLRVSVIIPTYNRAGYLQEALASVLAQTLAPWEIIVVDDGSTDDTQNVMKTYGAHVRYIRHEQNRRISAARNSGLDAAQGDVIAWLDSDDLWEPDFLATVIAVLDKDESIDGVYTGLIRIDASGNILPQGSLWSVPPEELFSSLVESCNIQTSTFVARKGCFDKIGEFDTQFDICEDYDMFLRIARSFRIVGVPRALVRYRVHPQNTIGNLTVYCQSRLALTEKHFGNADGDSRTWSDEKRRAHAHAYRAAAFKCIEHKLSDMGWQYLRRAISISPALLERIDTFYELICGDQPMGIRGQASVLDIIANGADMLSRLEMFFEEATSSVQALRSITFGNAYLALAMLSDQAGRWREARRYMSRALRANPRLLLSHQVLRRSIKLCIGKRFVSVVKQWRS